MRRPLLALGVVLAAGGVALVVYLAVQPGGGGVLTGDAFRVSYPSSWRVVRDHPDAVLARSDGTARVTIARDQPETLNGPLLVRQVRADFTERLEDYRLLSAGMRHTDAGGVFVYSYLQPDARKVHTVVLVPAGNHSFLLSTVAMRGASGVTRQIDGIISSFRPS